MRGVVIVTNRQLDFAASFEALTDNPPFPWQRVWYEHLAAGRFEKIKTCSLPTGLGKTSVIACWLIALANDTENIVPRRLVYVVNRRTVVDQATDEANKLRDKLGDKSNNNRQLAALKAQLQKLSATALQADEPPLAISTLRGQFEDNREWSADPSKPTIIVGTVDMIGSRLLFSGYGCGFKSKPLHAGFLGQDVLLVHDEAHLEKPFQELLIAIENEQRNEPSELGEKYHLKVIELSATPRGGGDVFSLTEEDERNEVIQKRIRAKKLLVSVPLEVREEKKLPDRLAELALVHKDSNRAILVFARTVDTVEKVAEKLRKAAGKDFVETLTGTLRGKERDELVNKPVFLRFLTKAERENKTVYLVCTSAGEVGINISADHLACDLSTFESMAQRLGRVNRFGDRDDTRIDIVHPNEFDDKDDFESRLKATLELLTRLKGNGSPAAFGELNLKDRLAAFAPTATILPTSDILFDAWAMTSIKDKLPGRPVVEPYLHGISDDPPQTIIAWRQEVELLTPEVLERNKLEPEDILDLYPLKPHEELSGPTYGKNKVFEQFEKIAARDAKREPNLRLSAWVIEPDGSIAIYPLVKLAEKDKQNKPLIPLGGRTVLLPPHAGGFSGGLLQGDEPFSEAIEYDVSDQWYTDKKMSIRRRWRGNADDDDFETETEKMRLIRSIYIPAPGDDEDTGGWSWLWFTRPKSADDDGSKTSHDATTLDHHTNDVEQEAKRLADLLLRDKPALRAALILAARFHDLGKCRSVWQRSIGNDDYPKKKYAKSGRLPYGGQLKPREITGYRHEFGSLVDVLDQQQQHLAELQRLTEDMQDLVLHLIAAHHGRGRPHFPSNGDSDEAFDPEPKGQNLATIATAVPRRFARLQRKYGRWGLAYLESLLRAADYAASAKPSPEGFVTEDKQ
ncbi:MAG TPA: type I-U CRISPR-associated helicase/endonuclease Cas3 [Pirellulales bacterium]|nr:type I-U CRISPR-associated helicase/endonuclease Cas3 [Pirellulales bacterium]